MHKADADFQKELQGYFSHTETEEILEFLDSLDRFLLELSTAEDLRKAYAGHFNALKENALIDSFQWEVGAFVSTLPERQRNLIWDWSLGFSPTGINRKGPYLLRPMLIIHQESKIGQYIDHYLRRGSFSFGERFFTYWGAFEQPFSSALPLIFDSSEEFDLSIPEDRLFIGICIVQVLYNGLITTEQFERHYKQHIATAIDDVNKYRQSKGLPKRDYEGELIKKNSSR